MGSASPKAAAPLAEGDKVVYGIDLWLWVAALAFHWSLLTKSGARNGRG